MKNSYFVTPRTLDQAVFIGDADPIEKPLVEDRYVGWGMAIIGVIAIGLLWLTH